MVQPLYFLLHLFAAAFLPHPIHIFVNNGCAPSASPDCYDSDKPGVWYSFLLLLLFFFYFFFLPSFPPTPPCVFALTLRISLFTLRIGWIRNWIGILTNMEASSSSSSRPSTSGYPTFSSTTSIYVRLFTKFESSTSFQFWRVCAMIRMHKYCPTLKVALSRQNIM